MPSKPSFKFSISHKHIYMALTIRHSLLLLSLLMILTLVRSGPPVIHRMSRARAFIHYQCRTTLYSDLCERSLSYYANNLTSLSHHRLAQIALKVSLARAKSTQAYLMGVATQLNRTYKGKDYRAVNECLTQIYDGVEQLSNCINETQNITENGTSSDFPWHASNIKTWMSTALTDVSMCIDGFSSRAVGGKTKAMIKARVLNLQQLISNGLALFNRFAARYNTSSHVNKPKV